MCTPCRATQGLTSVECVSKKICAHHNNIMSLWEVAWPIFIGTFLAIVATFFLMGKLHTLARGPRRLFDRLLRPKRHGCGCRGRCKCMGRWKKHMTKHWKKRGCAGKKKKKPCHKSMWVNRRDPGVARGKENATGGSRRHLPDRMPPPSSSPPNRSMMMMTDMPSSTTLPSTPLPAPASSVAPETGTPVPSSMPPASVTPWPNPPFHGCMHS